MKKRKFFNYLSKKYNMPYAYINFKLEPFYPYKANYEISKEYAEEFEKAVNWEYMKEDFEIDRKRECSIFYGM